MANRRGITIGVTLGLLGAVTLALCIVYWVWLPATDATLVQHGNRLQQRIADLGARNRALSSETAQTRIIEQLPEVAALPGWAGEVLADISAAGAMDVGYTLGDTESKNGTTQRQVKVVFQANVTTLGDIFDRVTHWRPGVAVSQVDLDQGDAGMIEVSLELTLLGRDDA